MKKLLLPLVLASTTLLGSLQLHAEDLIDQSSNIFKFQQKMAHKGNVNAEYKLAFMYEKGDGVEANIEKAKSWYASAAAAGSVSAKQRSEYLKILERGYDVTEDTSWLTSVKASAADRNAEAMYLMAQLYQAGLGVKKNLEKSLALYQQVASLGVADVEPEITAINKTLQAKKQVAKQQVALHKNSSIQASQKPARVSTVTKSKSVQEIAQAERLKKEEKRKRYEKVMEQLRLEQQLINDQQKSVSGGVVANADDEI